MLLSVRKHRLGVLLVGSLMLLLLLTSTVTSSAFAADSSASQAQLDLSSIHKSEDSTQAKIDGVSFGLSHISRSNKGTERAIGDISYGMRYTVAGQDSVVLIAFDDLLVIRVSESTAAKLQSQWQSSEVVYREALLKMMAAADDSLSNGGIKLSTLIDSSTAIQWTNQVTLDFFTSNQDVNALFDIIDLSDNRYIYLAVRPVNYLNRLAGDGSIIDLRGNASNNQLNTPEFVLSAQIVEAAEVETYVDPGFWGGIAKFLTSVDLSPLWVSLRTSGVAMIFIFVLGIAAAVWTMKLPSKLKGVIDAIFTIPMVLPPTVCGLLLLMLFGQYTGFGRWLLDHGIELVFSWPAAVMAATVVGFPLMYRTARGAFEALDHSVSDTARTLGWSEPRIFFKLLIPLAWPSIAAGTVLAFARALGEFGATLFVAGNYAGITQTIPIAIYYEWMGGSSAVAIFWVCVVILISLVIFVFINWYSSHTQKYRLGGNSSKN